MKFNERVYEIVKKIPKGKISTYKNVAEALNCKAYRAVGNALNKNPFSPIVPCHRIICSNGFVGGFASGVKNKIKMLRKEGIFVEDGKIELSKYFYRLK